MAGSQYPQTTRSLLKLGLLLIYYITSLLCSVGKSHHLHRRYINPFPQLLASHYLKTSFVLNKFNSGHSGKPKVCLKQFKFQSREPSGFRIPDSGFRRNNTLISFRKAGHVVPTPFLLHVNCSVAIVAAQ